MADSKLTALSEISVPALEDLLYVVDDPSGTPLSAKQTATRFLGQLNHVCQGRLTLTSGTPITTSDVTGATSIYFAPFNGNCVALYDGTRWRMYTFTELTLSIGTVVKGQGYDVFLYDNSGTLTLEALEWANATVTMTIASPCVVTWTGHGLSTGQSITFTTSGALPTGLAVDTPYKVTVVDANTFKLSTTLITLGAGTFINTSGSQSGTHTGHAPHARATALTTQNGVYVKSGATTRRHVGSFLTTSTTATEDSATKRFLWNRYNRSTRHLRQGYTTSSWSVSGDVWGQANSDTANQVEVFAGDTGCLIALDLSQSFAGSTNFESVSAIGENSIKTQDANCIYSRNGGNTSSILGTKVFLRKYAPLGYAVYTWMERADAVLNSYYNATYDLVGITGHMDL